MNQVEMSVYDKLRAFVKKNEISYEELEHEAEGRCEVVSRLRGNAVEEAAKAMVVMVKMTRKSRAYYLAVVPADGRVDMEAIRDHFGARSCSLAPGDKAMELSGCSMGAVPPISFHPELKLLADPGLLKHSRMFFNAGRLDRSFAVDGRSFLTCAGAEMVDICDRVHQG